MLKRILLWGIPALFIIIQFIRPDRSVAETDPSADIIAQTNAPKAIKELLQQACYDCHSHQTTYPWYSEIAPVSWWMQDHVHHGSEHLNFSEWGSYPAKKAAHKLEECIEEVEKGEMPLDSYTWMHAEADLSEEQRQLLMNWFKEQLQLIGTVD